MPPEPATEPQAPVVQQNQPQHEPAYDEFKRKVQERMAEQPPPPSNPPAPRNGIVTVSIGGEEIPLRLQLALNQPRPVEIDDGKSGGFFGPLAAAAREGNDSAARALFEALEFCKYYPKTRAEFDAGQKKRAEQFAQTGGVVVPGEKTQSWDNLSKDLEAGFHRCEGVTDDMYQTATELLRESVERGSDDSRLLYAGAIASTSPEEAHAQYETLWQKGYLIGLGGLAKESLPHRIASFAAVALTDPSRARQKLSALEASTSPSEFQEASKEAAQILKNPNCCRL
jgi:hypothetical protein